MSESPAPLPPPGGECGGELAVPCPLVHSPLSTVPPLLKCSHPPAPSLGRGSETVKGCCRRAVPGGTAGARVTRQWLPPVLYSDSPCMPLPLPPSIPSEVYHWRPQLSASSHWWNLLQFLAGFLAGLLAVFLAGLLAGFLSPAASISVRGSEAPSSTVGPALYSAVQWSCCWGEILYFSQSLCYQGNIWHFPASLTESGQ